MNIDGRIVAITGAGSGIGAALAHEAASRGAAGIAVIDIDEDSARAVAAVLSEAGTPATAYQCDISDPDAVESVADAVITDMGTPGLVCANAGITTDGAALLDDSPANLNWALSVNVTGTWATLRSFGRHLVAASDPGWLLVTASEHALGVPFPGNGFYTMSKHAVLGLADVLRHELPNHVGISVVLPGLVATGIAHSSSRRPARFGGPTADSDAAQALVALGMDPGVVAGAAIDGVQRESFLIATHAHARKYWDKRNADIEAAFAALAASGIDATSYDVTELIAQFAQ